MNKMKPTELILSYMHSVYQSYVRSGFAGAKGKLMAYEQMLSCFLAFIKSDEKLLEHSLHLIAKFLVKTLNHVGKMHSNRLESMVSSKDLSGIESARQNIRYVKEFKDSAIHFLSGHKPQENKKKDGDA